MNKIPTHHLKDHLIGINVERIDHPNPYNFKNLHRHNYFEVFLFQTGGGEQIIDFELIPIRDHSIYIVFPDQVHLMKRAPEANGFVLQFEADFAYSLHLLPLQNQAVKSFVIEAPSFKEFVKLVLDIEQNSKSVSSSKREIGINYLKIFFLKLYDQIHLPTYNQEDELSQFLHLIEQHFREEKKVDFYIKKMNISSKKINHLSKKHKGKTALTIIHDRLILEIKRKMAFEQLSIKEMAYDLHFDSPASFTAFVKKKTGETPSQLKYSLEQIHK